MVSKPSWFPSDMNWETLDEDTQSLCVNDEHAAKAALGIEDKAAPVTVEIARAGRPPDAKQILDLLAPKVSDATKQAFVKEINANEDHRQVRLRNWVVFQHDFGMLLEGLPNSGSERTEGRNMPFDVYKWNEPRKRGEGMKELEGSVLDDLHDEVIGLELTKKISELEARAADPSEGKSVRLQSELSRQRNRRATGRKYVHEAVEFGKQWAAFKILPNVGIKFMPAIDLEAGQGTLDKDGYVDLSKVNRGPDCLQIFVKFVDAEGTHEDDHRKISVGTFLRYKVQKAIDKVGGAQKVTLKDVIETVPKKKRKTGGKAGDEATETTDDVNINNMNRFDSAFGDIAAMVEDEGDQASFWLYINKRDKTGEYVNDDLLSSMDTFVRFYNKQVATKTEIKARLKKLYEAAAGGVVEAA